MSNQTRKSNQTSQPAQPTQPTQPRYRWLRELLWWGTFCLVAFAMRSSVASTYRVPSESMEPTIIPGDRLFASQMSFGLRLPFSNRQLTPKTMPTPGQIVIFPSPTDPLNLIKRVVAVGGDTIAVRQGRIWLNGQPLPLTTIPKAPPGYQRYWEQNRGARYIVQWDSRNPNLRHMPPTKIPPGHFFVMGDNRDYSGDSRIFGSISKDQLQAKALRHFYSVERDFPYIRWGRLFAPLQ